MNPLAKAVEMNLQATRLFAFELAKGLMDAKALTDQQASAIMVATAEQMRKFTEGENDEALGEAFARGFEEVGAWLLGGRLPPD